nr:uncharacterized protein LOC113807214 [Penaeus vannamei]
MTQTLLLVVQQYECCRSLVVFNRQVKYQSWYLQYLRASLDEPQGVQRPYLGASGAHSPPDDFSGAYMIIALRQFQEKAIEQRMALCIVFIDFTKAFDSLGRDALWRIMMKYGCPPRLLAVIKAFHTDMRATVNVNGETSDFVQVLHGVKQKCILAPTLFALFLAAVIEEMADNSLGGIIHSYSPAPGQPHAPPRVLLGGIPLVEAKNFTYLGSSVANDNSMDSEIDARVRAAAAAFGRFKDRLWKVKAIRLNTKLIVYKVVVLRALLYGLEVSTLYARHVRRLSLLVQRYLRGLMGITWKDHITNVEVLRRANISSMEAMIARSQLTWTGHVIRMSEERLPRALLFAELKDGTRPRGRPRLRFKDTVKRCLTAGITYQQLEKLASDRAGWRSLVSEGTKNGHQRLGKPRKRPEA